MNAPIRITQTENNINEATKVTCIIIADKQNKIQVITHLLTSNERLTESILHQKYSRILPTMW